METFYKLFGSLLSFVYHCFDRMVILAYLPLLTREENIVHFFRDVNGIWPLTQEALRGAHQPLSGLGGLLRCAIMGFPSSGPKKACARRITWLLPFSGCVGRTSSASITSCAAWRSGPPSAPFSPAIPWRIPTTVSCVAGEAAILIFTSTSTIRYWEPCPFASVLFLPFQINCYLNGHSFIERELMRRGIGYRKNDNAFLGGRRSRGAAADCRQLQCGAHPASARLLD